MKPQACSAGSKCSPTQSIHGDFSPCCTWQACSILYKTKLPLILVFNKCDVQSNEFALEWMKVSFDGHAALRT